MASILLQNLYAHPLVDSVGYVLLFLASFLAGVVIQDLRYVVIGWVTALCASLVIAFCLLSLPLFLGLVVQVSLGQEFYAGIIVMLFRAVFPNIIIVTLFSSMIGAIVGDRVGI
jgi:biotin transporter BioY